jgi:hypothetical protein
MQMFGYCATWYRYNRRANCGPGTTLSAVTSAGSISWYEAAITGTAIATGASFTTPYLASSKTYYVGITANGCSSTRIPVTASINVIPTITSNTQIKMWRRYS